jgi:hypothetical protein
LNILHQAIKIFIIWGIYGNVFKIIKENELYKVFSGGLLKKNDKNNLGKYLKIEK